MSSDTRADRGSCGLNLDGSMLVSGIVHGRLYAHLIAAGVATMPFLCESGYDAGQVMNGGVWVPSSKRLRMRECSAALWW